MPDRARKRAIRALAAELGVAYSVAARLLAAQAPAPARHRSAGSPTSGDDHRAWMLEARANRSFHARVHDTRLAADLPLGRAEHLVRRFPPLRAVPAGPLYAGEGRETTIAMLYAVLAHESPALPPPRDELAWAAELGEEAAVDIACAGLDRAARRLLDHDRWRLWARIEAALTAGETDADRRVRDAAITLGRELRSTSLSGSLDGVRHILDALLAEPFGALPPGAQVRLSGAEPGGAGPSGTQVRLSGAEPGGVDGTVVGAEWGQTGPPTGYRVHLDTEAGPRTVPATGLHATPAAEPDLIPG
ncbi:hypothetical protein Asi03nite_29550 [Actinoplanes siamensis]|uniref:Uncharacterized protein n=1 Tax=Actinoplanes siamensis TaxID=1223317 RepID=A0A919N6U2_9ACTN|nr:hypothetical protein Asi03nite_29550 [Actinoplanes siamensis]